MLRRWSITGVSCCFAGRRDMKWVICGTPDICVFAIRSIGMSDIVLPRFLSVLYEPTGIQNAFHNVFWPIRPASCIGLYQISFDNQLSRFQKISILSKPCMSTPCSMEVRLTGGRLFSSFACSFSHSSEDFLLM